MSKQERWVFRIPSNVEGDQFLKDMRKYLNNDSYKISKHYTGIRPKGTNQHSTSKENATSVRVYVESRKVEDNVDPYLFDHIQRGEEIEKNQQSLKRSGLEKYLDNFGVGLDEWDDLNIRLDNTETELSNLRTLIDYGYRRR